MVVTVQAYAIGNLSPIGIKGVYVRESRTDVVLETDHNNPTDCINNRILIIVADEFANSDQMVSAFMAAHLAGRKVSGWVLNCSGEWGKLSAINIEY